MINLLATMPRHLVAHGKREGGTKKKGHYRKIPVSFHGILGVDDVAT